MRRLLLFSIIALVTAPLFGQQQRPPQRNQPAPAPTPGPQKTQPPQPQPQRASLDDTARFLAGIPVGGPLASLTQDPAWLDHAQNLDHAWVKKDFYQIRPIRTWMLLNVPEQYAATDTCF